MNPHTDHPAADPYDLGRFVAAQAGCYQQVVDELRAGQKRSHWMWFIFPQFAGLGFSETSRLYAIGSLAEARAYLHHPLLGARLAACTAIVNKLQGRSARQIFGVIDEIKFGSSMTLFELAAPSDTIFASALEKYFAGKRDARSQALIRKAAEEQHLSAPGKFDPP